MPSHPLWLPPSNSLRIEGILKRYPEIGERPKKVLWNTPTGSIEPPEEVLSSPLLAPKKVLKNPSERDFRTTDRVLLNILHRTPPPPLKVTLLIGGGPTNP